MVTYVHLVVAVLLLTVATVCSARSKHGNLLPLEEQLKYLMPLAGCWEEMHTKDGALMCRQYFGYSFVGNVTLNMHGGFNNYLVINDHYLRSPVAEFEPGTDDTAVFAVRVPCPDRTAYATWVLGSGNAHSRIGDITHHCKHVTDPNAAPRVYNDEQKKKTVKAIDKHADAWHDQHRPMFVGREIEEAPVAERGLIQLAFGGAAAAKCVRVPPLGTLIGADLLGISMHAPSETCLALGADAVSVGLRWVIASNCMSPEHDAEAFVELRLPCSNAQLLFGLSDNTLYTENSWPKTLPDDFEPPRAGQIFYAPALGRALQTLLKKTAVQRQHSADAALWIEVFDMSATGRATLDSQLISGSMLRLHTSEHDAHAELSMRDSPVRGNVLIKPVYECTNVLSTGMCLSWFGYEMASTDGSAAPLQHRPVGVRNRFSQPPYDRAQITHFKPGLHNYATMVEWNCTTDGSGAVQQLQWILDGVATATPLGPSCRLGCDGRIDSTKQYDDCGVCGGDGSSCVDARHEYFVDSRGNTLRKYCDGVHEKRVMLDFDAVQTFNTRRGTLLNPGADYHMSVSSSKAMVLLNSATPPRDRLGLGTPSAALKGGVGIGANGVYSNVEPQQMVLAFDSDLGTPGCMRFSFDKPSQLHSLTVLNVPSTCKVSDSVIPVFSSPSDLIGDSQQQLERENAYYLSKMQQSRCTNQKHCEAETDYFSRDYYYINVTDSRDTRSFCYYNYHCNDGNPCTSDVCVHGCCMHADVYGCCSCDDDCSVSVPVDACCEYYCCAHTRRCLRRQIENCCSEDSDCVALAQQDDCLEHYCDADTQQCAVRGIVGCCHSNSDCAGLFDQSDQCSIPICGIDNTCHVLPKQCDSGQCNPQTGQCVTATPTSTPTASATPSASPTVSNSATASRTPTSTPSQTPSTSNSATPSGSATATPSGTPTISNSATPSASGTPTPSNSATASLSSSATPSQTPSTSHSSTPSMSASTTPSVSGTPTSSSTATSSPTSTPSATATRTPTQSGTPTSSITPTQSFSATATNTPTSSATATTTPSPSSSATPTASITSTATPTISASSSATPTSSATPSSTPSISASSTATPTSTVTASSTPSISTTSTASQSQTPTVSASSTASVTPTRTPTSSGTSTRTPTPSTTPSPCCPPGFQWHPVLKRCFYTGPFSESTPSITPSATPSVGSTPSVTPSATPTMTWWPSETPTPSRTPSSSSTPGCPSGYQWNVLLSICIWIGLKRSDDIPQYVQPLNYHGLPSPSSAQLNVRSSLAVSADTQEHRPYHMFYLHSTAKTHAARFSNSLQGFQPQAHQDKRYVRDVEYSSSVIVQRTNGEAIRLDVPPGAANNGVYKFELAGVETSSVEVCMCDSQGAVTDVEYTFPGSGKVVDTCGECGGNSTRCTSLETTAARVEHKFSTDPVVVRRLGGDGHDTIYETCYYHQRTHLDTDDFSGRAVRLSFGPITSSMSLRDTGSCDSSAPVPREANGELFCTMFGGPQTFLNRALWSLTLLGECNFDRPLSECPAGSGQGGFRMCANFTLQQLTRCKDAYGEGILRSEDSTHSRMAYHGALYATEFEPVSCKSEYAGQRVVHSTIKRFTIYTSFSGKAAAVDFTDGWADFDTDVAGVVCQENGNLAVTMRTSVSANNRLLNPTIASNSLIDPSTGGGIPVGIGEIHSSTSGSSCVTGDKCEQTWYISTAVALNNYAGELKINFQLERESTLHSVVSTGLRLNANCRAAFERYKNTVGKAMILPSGKSALANVDVSDRAAVLTASAAMEKHTEAESVMRNSKGYAATLTLFNDRALTSPYASSGPFVQHFKHADMVYATLEVATIDEIKQHEFAPHLVVDKMYVCYSLAQEAYRVYQPTKPHKTGCLAQGAWVVSELSDSGKITSVGHKLNYEEFSYDTDLMHLAFAFKARAPSDAPLFIDVRWHIEWGKALLRGVTTDEIAATRIKQHLLAGTDASDLSTFHFILPPRNIKHTRELASKNRVDEARLHAAHLVAHQIGIGPVQMRSLITGRVDYAAGLLSKNAPVVRDGVVYSLFNDEMWHGASATHFYTECAEPETQRVSSDLGEKYHNAKCADCGSHCKRSDSLFYQPQYRCDECCYECGEHDQWNECPWNDCAPPACFSDCDGNFGWPEWCGQLLLWPIFIVVVLLICAAAMCPMQFPSCAPDDHCTMHKHVDHKEGAVYVRHTQRRLLRRRRLITGVASDPRSAAVVVSPTRLPMRRRTQQ